MFRKLTSRTSFVLLAVISGLFISCRSDEPQNPSEQEEQFVTSEEVIIYETDSTEWHIRLFKEHLLYSEAVAVELPEPWRLPSREEAQILKTCSYPHEERFITSDGYTFGMPSSSVSKAGQQTKYSVLGLWKRPTVIVIEF